tara:strand:- start:2336 stop:2968 length:633 start_codon:yes stop_codon:yes gene_type:complete
MALKLIYLFLSCFSGIVIFYSLKISGHRWVNTKSLFLTYTLLPPTGFVITSVISNNIALSLGMIGALSIVRFRNPVKNPLELVVFFILITIGISFSANYKWGILLSILTCVLILGIKITEKIFKMRIFDYSYSFFDESFVNTIEVESKESIQELEKNNKLKFFSNYIEQNNKIYFYKLSFASKEDLNKLLPILKKNNNILKLEVRLSDNE